MGGPAGLTIEGPAEIEGDSNAWGFNVGALVHYQKTKVGISYRSKIEQNLKGDVTFTGAPTFSTSGPFGQIGAVINGRFASGPVKTSIDLPDTFSIALAQGIGDKVEMLADYTYAGWDSIQELAVDRDVSPVVAMSSEKLAFENTWRMGIGFSYQAKENLKLRCGYAFDRAPVQDQYRTPRMPDSNRNWAALGFQYKVGKKGAIDVGYAHIFVNEGVSDLPNQESATSPPTGILKGTYNNKVDIVSAQFTMSF
jgi:long-chain fatty acid transport protein